MEGCHLYHAYRISHGLYLYGDPARGFATFPYPPVYWTVLSATGGLFGLDYPTARALSIACIVGAGAILAGAIVWHAPSRAVGVVLAVLAFGGIAAGYPFAGAAYDLARGDAMAIFFPVLGAAILGDGRVRLGRAAIAGGVLTLAIYTKQTGVFFAVWLIVFAYVRDARGGILLLCATGASSAALLGAFCAATGGWFWTWLFDQARHGLRGHDEWSAAIGHFAVHAPFLVALPWFVAEARRREWLRPVTVKWVGLLGAAIVASMVPFMKVGGWVNVLIPVFVLSWPVALLLVCDFLHALPAQGTASRAAFWGTLIAGAATLWLLAFDPSPFVPTTERTERARRLRAFVHDLDGPVVFTTSPFVPILEGKQPNEQPILQGFIDAKAGELDGDYARALERSGAEYLIVGALNDTRDYRPGLRRSFDLVRDLDFGVQTQPALPFSLWKRASAPRP